MTNMELGTVGLPIGSPAIDFQLKGADGKVYTLQSIRDEKALVVALTCNHCPYVQDYEDRMIQLQRDYNPNGVTLVAINSNDDKDYPEHSFEKMVQISHENGFNFPYVRHDADDIA